MLFFDSKPAQFVGIDIGSSGIKLVELRAQNKRGYMQTYAFSDTRVPFRYAKTDEERAALIDETAQMLGAVAKAAKTVSTTAITAVPQRDIFSTIITVANTDTKELVTNVAREIEKLIPFPLADAVLDTRIIEHLPQEAEEYKKIKRVFVTAARKKIIQFYSDICSRAGFKLNSIETETFATIRSLLGNDPSPVLIIDMGKQITSLSYISRLIPHVDVAIELGGDKINELLGKAWNKNPAEVEQMKTDAFDALGDEQDPQLATLLEPLTKPLTKSIEGVFETMRRVQAGELARPDKIILTGGAANCPGLAKKIEQQFSIKTFAADPWSRVVTPSGLKPVLDRMGARCAVAIGLAQRPIIS